MKYRLLFRDRRHRLVDRFEFLAPNDAIAEEVAEDLVATPCKELWSGRRLVRLWEQDKVELRIQ